MKAELETLENGSVKLTVVGEANEITKVYELVTKQLSAFMKGINASKEKVD